MNRDEWKQADHETRPGIRFCIPAAEPFTGSPTSEIQSCNWCDRDIWVEMRQEMTAEVRQRGTIPICIRCALDDPDLGPPIISSMPEVARYWEETGIIKPIIIDSEL